MHTSLFKTSIYTRSLLANPPAVALPQIPTLAELRERTEAMPLPIPIPSQTKDQATQTSSSSLSSSSWSSPKSLLPAYSTGSSPPEYQPPTLLKNSFMRLNKTNTEGQKGITMKGSRGYVRDVKGRFGLSPSPALVALD